MSFVNSHQLFFFLLLVPFLPIATFGLDPMLYISCGKNLTKNGILQSNINNLFIDIKKMVSTQGFAISSSGNSYDAVYGVARCQEDLSPEECSLCITDAAEEIQTTCPDSADARVWHEYCFLRYDTLNFIGKADVRYADVWWSSLVAKNPEAFEHRLTELMVEVMASTAGEKIKFSYVEKLFEGNKNKTIYGMAQCTRDLEKSTCSQCLEYSFKAMKSSCGNALGCRIFGSSCAIRYEIYKFLGIHNGDALGDALAPAPAPTSDVYY